MAKRKILSVGGSIVIPKTGFDLPFLKKFRKLILDEVARGEKFILVIGGGGTARAYQGAARDLGVKDDTVLDWIGIDATIMNAKFVQKLFGDYAAKEVVIDPRKKLRTSKPIIMAAGWKPGMSTDADGVLLAKTYEVKDLMNLSNIAYAYDKDPNKYPDAKRIEHIDWATFRKEIVGDEWVPGKSVPFDPVASKKAEALKLRVSIMDGTNLPNLRKAIRGEKFKGTVIE